MKCLEKIFFFILLLNSNNLYSQCSVVVDTANISHIVCPNGGAVGAAQIIQATYLNYSWQNVTNGQLYNGGGGVGGTSRSDLDAGLYVITASSPYSSSCPDTIYSDTFVVKMPTAAMQSNPTQACPNECNVDVDLILSNPIDMISYSYSVDALQIITANQTFNNLCGGTHTFEIFADGQSCGIENFGISQFSPLNMSTNVTNASCTQNGSASVNITGVGASALNNYCNSSPQYLDYSVIENVYLIGDSLTINNNTANICNLYSDFTSISANLTPGNTYSLSVNLGTCHPLGFSFIDFANVYIDWNIDGDFDDINELVGLIAPTQSPSSHNINFTVPNNAIPGESRLRIVSQNFQYQPNNLANACDNNTAWFGETEDYSLIISGSVANPVNYLWSDGQTTSTATNLSPGIYTISITDANGCTAVDTAIISGANLIDVIAGTDQTICNGGLPNPLSANSSSLGTYSWSPSSFFVNPNVQNPTFSNSLNSTTIFVVTLIDSLGCLAHDTTVVNVNLLPSVSLVVQPNQPCMNDNIILTANTSIPANIYRFQFNDGGGWQNITTQTQWGWGFLNPVTFNNISTTTQFRVRVREDWGCNTSQWSQIISVPINQVFTNPISHN